MTFGVQAPPKNFIQAVRGQPDGGGGTLLLRRFTAIESPS
jgi:hypothetical protein